MRHASRFVLVASLVSLAGCTSPFDDAYDAGRRDAGARLDGGAQDASGDAGHDAAIDAAIDAFVLVVDGGDDAGTDAGMAIDAGTDAGMAIDAGADAASPDAGMDAATPADAGSDAGRDAATCATTTACGSSCVNCTTTLTHVATPICSPSGFCDYTTCSMGFVDCDGMRADGCETAQDGTHCGASCTNCASAVQHATGTTCTSSACDFMACSGAFSNCDANRANGCETAWGPTACGGACTNCSATTLHASGLICTASGTCDYAACTAGFSDCNGNRADGCEAAWSTMACGAACTSCATTTLHATATTCTAGGTCDYMACTTGFNDCDGNRANGCEHTQSSTSCGTSCTNCTTGFQHGTPACTAGTCTISTCTMGFANCNGMASDGCEWATAGTDLDCCMVSCNTGGGFHCGGSATGGFSCR